MKKQQLFMDNAGLYIAGLAIFFVSVTVSVFAVLSFLLYLNNKKQAKIQRQSDEDEQHE